MLHPEGEQCTSVLVLSHLSLNLFGAWGWSVWPADCKSHWSEQVSMRNDLQHPSCVSKRWSALHSGGSLFPHTSKANWTFPADWTPFPSSSNISINFFNSKSNKTLIGVNKYRKLLIIRNWKRKEISGVCKAKKTMRSILLEGESRLRKITGYQQAKFKTF